MTEKSVIEQLLELGTKSIEKSVQEQENLKEKIKKEKNNEQAFLLNLRNNNIKTYNEYLNIFQELTENKPNKNIATVLKNQIEQLEKLIAVKQSNPYKEDHELANHLFLLKNNFVEFQIALERNSSKEHEEELEDKDTFLEYNQPALDRKHIAFLMRSMRYNRVFMSDVSITDLAKAFGSLTGLNQEKLRQFSMKGLEFTLEDKSKIKTILEKISKEVDELPSKNK